MKMFNNRFYKAAVLIIVMVSATSCNKFLTVRPEDGVTSDNFFQTKEQLQAAVIGIYNAMETGPATNFFVWGEVRGDYVTRGTTPSVDQVNIYNAALLPTNGICNWATFYSVINLCNNVIQNGPTVLSRDNTLTQTALNGYMGEAYAIRALMYFYLVRSFSDVPLVLKVTATDNDIVQIAKTPQKDVLTQIVADLTLAEAGAVASYGNNASDRGRITKFTVNAIQADVALWMDKYADCITACDKIINSGKYGLVAGDSGWFNNLYVAGNSSEGIFELQFDSQQLNPYFNLFAVSAKYQFAAAPGVLDNYTVDLVDPTNKDIRGIDVAVHPADGTIYKYIALTPNTLRTTDISFAHWIFYRYADILLLKAEACANSGRGQDALDLVAAIRTRAHALATSAPNIPAVGDVNGLTDYILAERGRELAFEGKRWYDLLRNAKRNNFARLDILLTAAQAVLPPLVQQSGLNKLRDPNSVYFPIYQTEIQNDPLLVQNPFYK